MQKKIFEVSLFTLIIFLGLVLITNVSSTSSNPASPAVDLLGQANISAYGDGVSNDSYTKGGNSEIVNLTVFYNGDGGDNVTNISISWVGNYTFDGWVSSGDVFEGACTDGGAGKCTGDNNVTAFHIANATIQNGEVGGWTCFNESIVSLVCYNNTQTSTLGPSNTTLTIRFNVTADASTEDKADWNISVLNDDGPSGLVANESTINTYVDGLAPYIAGINMTDGNITLVNGTGDGDSLFILNSSYRLDNRADLYVFATVEDLNGVDAVAENFWLVYASRSSDQLDGNLTSVPGNNAGSSANISGNGAILTPTVTKSWKAVHSHGRNTLSAILRWKIPNSVLVDGNVTEFAFLLNDSYNQAIAGGDGVDSGTAANHSFVVETNSTLPQFVTVNVTDGKFTKKNNQLNAVNGWLRPRNLTVGFDLTGIGVTNVSIFYNETGDMNVNPTDLSVGAPFINHDIGLFDQSYTEATTDYKVQNITDDSVNGGGTKRYEASLNMNSGNNTKTLSFILVANATLSGDDEHPANHSVIAGPYFIRFDSTAPSASLNTPKTRTIGVGDSIEYICSGSDSSSGVGGYTWELTKPNGAKVTDTKVETSAASNSRTFSGSDTSTLGTYSVKCTVSDVLDNTAQAQTSTSNDFTVSASAGSGSGGSSGGGGGSSGGAAVSFDADFTQVPKASFKASQGRIKSFSFDGSTKHTIAFNQITDNQVTLVISSDPVTVVLGLGESRDVDVNADGVNDVKVTLKSIVGGVADIEVQKLEEGADIVRREEETARGVEPQGPTTTPNVGGAGSALVWIIVGIVVIGVLAYFVNKKR